MKFYNNILILILLAMLFIIPVSAISQYNLTDGSYNISIFNGSAGSMNWVAPSGATSVWFMVVAGGGGGGGAYGAGGGAGGYLNGTTTNITTGNSYDVRIGAGGIAGTGAGVHAGDGGISRFSNITATGGGGGGDGGGGASYVGNTGGSGGGTVTPGGNGGAVSPSGQGNRGGNQGYGGGGGGSSTQGQDGPDATANIGGNGGNGTQNNITGTLTYYAGGGGAIGLTTPGTGGLGGGGAGALGGGVGTSGTNNLGGGGGGGGSTFDGGSGGVGVVIIRYTTASTASPYSNFTANITSGFSQLPVSFTDTSNNTPTSWTWYFTDVIGNNTKIQFSTIQNPTQIFTSGNYSISLNVSNAYGFNNSYNKLFINVTSPYYGGYGDSIMRGTMPAGFGDLNDTGSDVFLLQMRNNHNASSGAYHNMDGGGWTTQDGWINISTHYNKENAIYVIEFGTNDVCNVQSDCNTSATYIKQIYNYALNNGSRPIVLMPLLSTAPYGDSTQKILWLQSNLTQNGIPYVRMYDALDSKPFNNVMDSPNSTFLIDGLHPNKTGHYYMGEYLWGIISGSILEVKNFTPLASFTTNTSIGIAPQSVNFNDTSTNTPTQWNWSFGDGTWTNGTYNNISHNYSIGGNFTAYSIVSNSGGNAQSINHWINITQYNQTLTGFTANQTSGLFNLPVTFNVTKPIDNATQWNWSFGDGTWQNGTTQNATKIYSSGGTYTITETASNTVYSNTTTISNMITVLNTTVSSWTSNVTSGIVPFVVLFNDTAPNLNATTWNWTTNSQYSSLRNTTITYSTAGTYNVNHSANNTAYINWTNQSNYITAYSKPVISFSANITTGTFPPNKVILFNDTSDILNPTKWNYSYKIGSTNLWVNSTTSGNQTITFSNYGVYNIGLNVSNGSFSNWSQYLGYISIGNKTPIVNFTSNSTGGLYPTTIAFNTTGSISNNTLSWNWSFGDNTWTNTTTASTSNVSKTYSSGGVYSVTLYMRNDGGTNSTTKSNFITITNRTINNFTASNTSGVQPLVVRFTDTSYNATSWTWIFGDGNTSTQQSPLFIYNVPGTYSVNHSSSNGINHTFWTNTSNMITVTPRVAPIVNFTYNSSGGTQGTPVQFTSDSASTITAYNWSFGDGNLSTSQSPAFIYNVVGTFSVNLSVTNATGFNSTVKSNIITITPLIYAPVANFTQNQTSGLYPLAVQFNDTSSNTPTSWNWSFGDGTISTVQNATKVFSTGGLYQINLTVKNSNATYITKLSSVEVWNRTSNTFTANNVSGNVSLYTTFTDVSTNATSWFWDFGNGNTSTTKSPSFVYTTVGTYSVNHSSSNSNHTFWTNKSNYIVVYPPYVESVISNFTANQTTGVRPLSVLFTDQSSNTPTTWNWSFGDNNYSTSQNPVYTYQYAGTYTVTLNASNSNQTYFPMTKVGYITVTAIPPNALFTGAPASGFIPLNVTFTSTSTGDPPLSYNWSFGDGNYSTAVSPTYGYYTAGLYTVNLTVVNVAGTSTLSKPNYINASYPVSKVDFVANTTLGYIPFYVHFTDLSTGYPATSWNWSFGDGNYSTLQNPDHQYSSIALYTVSLTATNYGGSNTSTKINYINSTAIVSAPIASFNMNVSSGAPPLGVGFTDTSLFGPTAWNWSFGDGNYSSLQFPQHLYQGEGVYYIKLNASNLYGYNSTQKTLYVTLTPLIGGGSSSGSSSGTIWIEPNTMLSFIVISVPALLIITFLLFTNKRKKEY